MDYHQLPPIVAPEICFAGLCGVCMCLGNDLTSSLFSLLHTCASSRTSAALEIKLSMDLYQTLNVFLHLNAITAATFSYFNAFFNPHTCQVKAGLDSASPGKWHLERVAPPAVDFPVLPDHSPEVKNLFWRRSG